MTSHDSTMLAGYIDHAILRPELSRQEVIAELDKAAELGVFSVCVRPMDVAFAKQYLYQQHPQSPSCVSTVIGFPHGTTTTASKVAEATQAIIDGASELDMVINIGALKDNNQELVINDIRAVIAAAHHRAVKVILEVSLLDETEIIRGAKLVSQAGAAYVKTSTGFAGGGATPENIALLRKHSVPNIKVKASGGVRTASAARAVIAAGADRIGTSSSVQICTGEHSDESSGY